MSNEKLGAEQGRWRCETCDTVYAEYINGCPHCWEAGIRSGVRFVVTEQADHARGAGRPMLYALETADGAWIDGDNCVYSEPTEAQDDADSRNEDLDLAQHVRVVPLYRGEPGAGRVCPYCNGSGWGPYDPWMRQNPCVNCNGTGKAEREPGADTGTTPPPSTAEFEPLLRGELKHGRSCPAVGAPMDEGNCDCGLKWRIRLQTEMTLRNAWEKRAYEAEAALAAAERGTTPLRVTDVHGTASETGDSQAGYPEAGSIPVGAVNIPETQDFLLRELVTEWRYLAGEGERFDKDPVRRFRRDKDANYLVRESKRLRQCALQVEDILSKRAATQPDAACEGCISNGVEPHASFCAIEGRAPVERDKCE